MVKTLKLIWPSLKDSGSGFVDDKIPKLSASLAYYTVFSLGPMMIVIIFLSSLFFGQEAVEGNVYGQIEGFVGHSAAVQLQDMIKNATVADTGSFSAIIGIIALVIGATTMFAELQDSINMIWGLKQRPNVGIMKTITNRLLSFGVIGSLVFLLLVSLGASAMIQVLSDKLQDIFPNVTVIFFKVFNWVFTFAVTTVLFAVVFRVLPDAQITWKDILPGAIATAFLFLLGKFLISFYISSSDIGSTYGAAGSFVILLLWIYYSSMILYFGAEFTQSFAVNKGVHINPNHYAEWEPGHNPYEKKEKIDKKRLKKEEEKKADFKNKKESPDRQPQRHFVPVRASQGQHFNTRLVQPPSKKKKKDSPGMGTFLLGLALYFFNTGGKNKK
jgi:membrane protein